ncbi:MAG: aminotransferase class IV [Haloferacaceae archaeon]
MRYHVDGDLVPADEATVSVRDRGFRYGDAAFETVRVYGGDLFAWDAHAERLRRTCDRISLDPPPTDDLRDRAKTTLAANDLSDAYLRLSVTRGVDDGGLAPPTDPDRTVVVTVRDLPRGGVDGTTPWDGPSTLQTVKTRRVPSAAIPADAKTHNYLNGVLASIELRVSDADEAILLDDEGHVTEGTTSNVFFVADKGLHTPNLDGPVLPGVTRSLVIDLAESEGIPVHEGAYTPSDLRDADEVFVTSTTREIRPVGTVDGIDVAGGPVTPLLANLYDRYVEERCYAGESGDEAGGDGSDSPDASSPDDGDAESRSHDR